MSNQNVRQTVVRPVSSEYARRASAQTQVRYALQDVQIDLKAWYLVIVDGTRTTSCKLTTGVIPWERMAEARKDGKFVFLYAKGGILSYEGTKNMIPVTLKGFHRVRMSDLSAPVAPKQAVSPLPEPTYEDLPHDTTGDDLPF